MEKHLITYGKKLLKRINSVEKKIDEALKNEDFLSVPNLSKELDLLIKEFTATLEIQGKSSSSDLEELEKISNKLEFFKEQTAITFKEYRSKVSTQTKMHLAYNKYSE